ncbi:SAP domain-containing [Micractinium conductrix]|uniref:SAP domain-containing n=1 Tax=Micractinium conductrix TaxID=554055 RepID=A0A2P6VM95_9CHLO|nr:SAP domain-containing [Micractinium conductrix]|eukprot:PSC75214.1 SAP domain-containing [Micractinium conductrix]
MLRTVLSDLRSLAATLRATAAELPPLLAQLHYPPPGLVARRTLQVLAVVAAFVAYAWAVDSLWSLIPRFIRWSHAHPGWPGRAAAAALAAARQRLTGAA